MTKTYLHELGTALFDRLLGTRFHSKPDGRVERQRLQVVSQNPQRSLRVPSVAEVRTRLVPQKAPDPPLPIRGIHVDGPDFTRRRQCIRISTLADGDPTENGFAHRHRRPTRLTCHGQGSLARWIRADQSREIAGTRPARSPGRRPATTGREPRQSPWRRRLLRFVPPCPSSVAH